MALPSPTTAWKFVRFLVRAVEFTVPPALAWLEDQLDEHEASDDVAWIRAHAICTRDTPTGTSEDTAQIKLDLLNITGGEIDTSWTSADLTAINTKLEAYLSGLTGVMANNHTWTQLRYYIMRFNPTPDLTRPFADTGPPVRVTTISYDGAGTTPVPYQVAMSHTLKTAWPRHWGRFYMPAPSGGAGFYDAFGRFASTSIQARASALEQLIDDLADSDFLTVVPVGMIQPGGPASGSIPFHALLGVTDVQVDDVPDVIRRRRPKQPKVRALGVHS